MSRIIRRNPNAIFCKFTNDEMIDLWKVAETRQAPKDSNRYAIDKRRKMIPNIEMHFIGILGEYALAKYLGLEFDRQGYLSGDEIKDFVLPDGRTIEVKTLQGYLAFDMRYFHKEFRADIAVLAIYVKDRYKNKIMPYVTLEGWITKQEFINNMFTDDFGYGPRYCIQPIDLHPLNEIACNLESKSAVYQLSLPI